MKKFFNVIKKGSDSPTKEILPNIIDKLGEISMKENEAEKEDIGFSDEEISPNINIIQGEILMNKNEGEKESLPIKKEKISPYISIIKGKIYPHPIGRRKH